MRARGAEPDDALGQASAYMVTSCGVIVNASL